MRRRPQLTEMSPAELEALRAAASTGWCGQEWRYFPVAALRDALYWAGQGGVSVFDMGPPHQGRGSARLLARDPDDLMRAAAELCLDRQFVRIVSETPALTHFVLYGRLLESALIKCVAKTPAVATPYSDAIKPLVPTRAGSTVLS
jgi:hypothetical protein